MTGAGSPKRPLEHSEEEPSGYSHEIPLVSLNRGAIERVIEHEVKKARTNENFGSQVSNINESISAIKNDLNSFTGDFTRITTDLTEKFEGMDGRIGHITERLETHDMRFIRMFDTFKQALSEMSKDFNDRMDKMSKDFNDRMDKMSKDFNDRMDKMERDFNERMDKMDEKMDKMDEKINKVTNDSGEKFVSIESSLESLDKRQNDLARSIGHVKVEVGLARMGVGNIESMLAGAAHSFTRRPPPDVPPETR